MAVCSTASTAQVIKFCNVIIKQGQDEIVAEITGNDADALVKRQLEFPITGQTGFVDILFERRESKSTGKVFSNIKFVGFEAM